MYASLVFLTLLAQWGPGGCDGTPSSTSPVGLYSAVAFSGWQDGPDTAGGRCQYFYCNGRVISGIDAKGNYRTFDGRAWSEPRQPPWQPITHWCRCSPNCPCINCDCAANGQCNSGCKCSAQPQAKPRKIDPPTGVVEAKLGEHGERYTINGVPVTKETALDAVKVGQLPDDAKKLRLTIIGPKETREPVLSDLSGNLKHLANDLVVQDYDPDAPLIKGLGFKSDGKPSIYLQKPDGKVLLRKDKYDGPEALAMAIRKADPNYDSAKDPDGKKKPVAPTGERQFSPVLILFSIAAAAFIFWRK